MNIEPVQSTLFIELRGKYKNFTPTEEGRNFGGRTTKLRGIVLAMAADITPAVLKKIGAEKLKVGDMVYFAGYEDSAYFEEGGKEYALMKLEEIRGRSDA